MLQQYGAIYRQIKEFESVYVSNSIRSREIQNQVSLECRELDEECTTIQEGNVQKMKRIAAYINIANAHSAFPEESSYNREYDEKLLARLSVQINNASQNDYYANQLYTEATGQYQYLKWENHQIFSEYERKKVI